MFDIDSYLKHLGYTGTREPTAENLRELHLRHMITVPFDKSTGPFTRVRLRNVPLLLPRS